LLTILGLGIRLGAECLEPKQGRCYDWGDGDDRDDSGMRIALVKL